MRPGLSRQIRAAKEKNPRFMYAPDGVHPGPEGHLMIARSVWPAIASFLNLSPNVRFAEGDAFNKILERHNLFKLAWLSETGHKRPGIPAGVPHRRTAPHRGRCLDQDSPRTRGGPSLPQPEKYGPRRGLHPGCPPENGRFHAPGEQGARTHGTGKGFLKEPLSDHASGLQDRRGISLTFTGMSFTLVRALFATTHTYYDRPQNCYHRHRSDQPPGQ